MTLLPILLFPKQIGNLIPPKRYITMGESVFLDKYWKFSTINTASILSKNGYFFVKNAYLIP
jgi:hypothetical protein